MCPSHVIRYQARGHDHDAVVIMSRRQEERFLYPAYPSIFLAAACTLDIVVQVRAYYHIIPCRRVLQQ